MENLAPQVDANAGTYSFGGPHQPAGGPGPNGGVHSGVGQPGAFNFGTPMS